MLELTNDKRKELIEQYPYLLPRNVFTGKPVEDYDYHYINGEELPAGWFELFLQMCEDIKEPLEKAGFIDKFRFSQIKEKYGSMRCYTSGAPQEVCDIIDKYEILSEQVCCKCGAPASLQTLGYISPYCSKCYYETNQVEPITPEVSFTREIYKGNGQVEEQTISVEDEWNRYLAKLNANRKESV